MDCDLTARMDDVPLAVDALEVALKRINGGWCQRALYVADDHGQTSFCILGAISFTISDDVRSIHSGALDRIQRAIIEYVHSHDDQYELLRRHISGAITPPPVQRRPDDHT